MGGNDDCTAGGKTLKSELLFICLCLSSFIHMRRTLDVDHYLLHVGLLKVPGSG